MRCCGTSIHSDSESEGGERVTNTQPQIMEPTPSADTKRVILTIDGMKCGCCGDGGITRALDQIQGVQNHHVNIVLAKVEFDLDIRTMTVGKVRKKLTAATGYTFKQYFHPDGQVLDIIVDDPTEIYQVSSSTIHICARYSG